MDQEKKCKLESLVTLLTIDDGIIKILLEKRDVEPYKGYWSLPCCELGAEETLENSINNLVESKIGVDSIYLEQVSAFSEIDRVPNERVVGISYLGIVDSVTLKLKAKLQEGIELNWFSIDSIPKMAYDHEEIIDKTIKLIKSKIKDFSFLSKIFPVDFTLPELQSVYEQLTNVKVDRRNFRKKILNSDCIELTGEKMEGFMGRPANLYRFKKEKSIF